MTYLGTAFQSLPESVREWLSDEHVAATINEINQRLRLTEAGEKDKIIAHLILRLCVQDLDPRNFINELSHWLDIGFGSAKTLTKELEEKILQPIAASLKQEVGIDLRLLYFSQPEPPPPTLAPSAPPPPSSPPALELMSDAEPPMPAEPTTTLAPPPPEPPPSAVPIEKPTPSPEPLPPTPLILHEEKGMSQTAVPDTPIAKSSFLFKVPLELTPKKHEKPAKVTIENPPATRVVHYSSFRTLPAPDPLSPPTTSVKKISVPKSRWFI